MMAQACNDKVLHLPANIMLFYIQMVTFADKQTSSFGLIKSIFQNHQKMKITLCPIVPQVTNCSSQWRLSPLSVFVISFKC